MTEVRCMMMRCYGRFNSFRVQRIAMQDIDALFAYVFRIVTHHAPALI